MSEAEVFRAMQRTLADRLEAAVPNWGELSDADLLAYVRIQYEDGRIAMWDWVLELAQRLAGTDRSRAELVAQAFTADLHLDGMTAEVLSVSGIEDPRQRARRAHELMGEYVTALGLVSRLRRDAMSQVLDSSVMDQTELADLLGVTRSRVSQIMKPAGEAVSIDELSGRRVNPTD